jgi:hypothetical protein
MKECQYKCVITNDHFDEIHHLFPMNKIIKEALSNLNLEARKSVGLYSDNELELIINEVIRLHTIYPNGVCLRKDVHVLFHQKFGNKNFGINNFEEFKQQIANGEIKISEKENKTKEK